MKRAMLIMLAAGVVLAGMAIHADGFTNPPPFANHSYYAPGGTGRNVEFNFSTDPEWGLEPETHLGPRWDTDGPDGDWTCDDVRWQGAVTWYNATPGWPNHQGLFGIDNTAGMENLSGSLVFHINNFPDPNWEKWVWDEVVQYASTGATISRGLYPQPGSWLVSEQIINHTAVDIGWLDNLDGVIRPNPDAEEIIIDFFVPMGGEAYVDSFEFATLCVPEPGTIVLLISGGLGLLLWVWRRR